MSSVFERNPKKALTFVIIILVWGLDFAVAHLYIRPNTSIRVLNKTYHHDLLPNAITKERWGNTTYLILTNSLGFKDETARNVPLFSSKYRILFMGDSFTEGMGIPFGQTFVGLIGKKLEGQAEILNAAVASYSPKLYFLKIKDLLENKMLKFDEVAVFIDISDVQDEIVYSGFNNKTYIGARIKKCILDNSVIGRWLNQRGIIKIFREYLGLDYVLPSGIDPNMFRKNYSLERGRWTFDPIVYNKWGAIGVDLALKNMDELYMLLAARNIKMTVTVYPWPEQIVNGDLNSIQVGIWKKFCHERNIPFLNLFPIFIPPGIEASKMVLDNYIKGDDHWNEKGHEITADQWIKFRCDKRNIAKSTCFQH